MLKSGLIHLNKPGESLGNHDRRKRKSSSNFVVAQSCYKLGVACIFEGVVSIARMEEESLRAVPIRSPSPEAYPCEEGCFSCLKRFVKNRYESCFQFQAQYR